ncbi:MAG TPA: glutamine synthetase family protein [Stellaceae bacterium]|nr:glutamine synthetase family protein [Stellaceae bacterium]
MSLAERAGVWSAERAACAAEIEKRVAAEKIDTIRLSFADQHGLLRGKTILPDGIAMALRDGVRFTTTLLAKDTSHRTVFPVFSVAGGGFDMPEMAGAGDAVMLPDPASFRLLPWAHGTGWLLCDVHFADGRPVPFSTRHLYRGVLERLGAAGYDYMAGLEVEFHLFKLARDPLAPEDAGQPGTPPQVALLTKGYQYLTELRYDQLEPVLELLRRGLLALGLPLRSLEVEYGPSQVEFTFKPEIGLAPADTMVLFRSAVKQICRRNGYHATFMCRPLLPNLMSSGWHLHQSLRDRRTGANAFMPAAGEPLSPIGRHFLGGLLDHAAAAAPFTTPTINGYKRYRPYSLAPDRANWGCDNRGVMVRAIGGPDDPATRLENRIGEPAANPYLYMAAQIIAGLDGMSRALDPGPPTDQPYEAAAPPLPRSLEAALAALRRDALFREGFGDAFIDYFLRIKEAELQRFQLEVSEWEQREYFELF